MCTTCVSHAKKTRRGMGVTDGCEPPRGCCKSSPGPLQEQQMLSHFSSPTNYFCIFQNKTKLKEKETEKAEPIFGSSLQAKPLFCRQVQNRKGKVLNLPY